MNEVTNPSLYLITASTIFFIFLVSVGGLGESFSAGGRPRFFCFLLSSSLSLLRPLELGVDGPEGRGHGHGRASFSGSFSCSAPLFNLIKGAFLDGLRSSKMCQYAFVFITKGSIQSSCDSSFNFSHCFSVRESL